MARRRPSALGERDVLVACRRRCCLCFFLNDDRRARKGQLAHLARDSSRSEADDLVYLCFDHHDEYDGTTRQAKGLTELEVRAHRDRLVAVLATEAPLPGPAAVSAELGDGEVAEVTPRRHPWRHPWRFPFWLTADQPELFAYGAPAGDGVCAIERIDLPDGRVVVACVAVPGNPGNSVTNCAEYIVAQICERFRIDRSRLVWLENYDFFDRSEWTRVTFDFVDGDPLPRQPVWRRMTERDWAALGLSPRSGMASTDSGELRSKLAKRFPWPPAERMLGGD